MTTEIKPPEATPEAYKDMIMLMSDEDLLIERAACFNALEVATRGLVAARGTDNLPEKMRCIAIIHQNEHDLATVTGEMNRRRDAHYAELGRTTDVLSGQDAPTINQDEENAANDFEGVDVTKALYEARLKFLDHWLERTGDLTDLIRTGMSGALQQAGELPTEGGYDADTWQYPTIAEKAQHAEEMLVKARKHMKRAADYVEIAIRTVDYIRQNVKREAELKPDQPENSDIPF